MPPLSFLSLRLPLDTSGKTKGGFDVFDIALGLPFFFIYLYHPPSDAQRLFLPSRCAATSGYSEAWLPDTESNRDTALQP